MEVTLIYLQNYDYEICHLQIRAGPGGPAGAFQRRGVCGREPAGISGQAAGRSSAQSVSDEEERRDGRLSQRHSEGEAGRGLAARVQPDAGQHLGQVPGAQGGVEAFLPRHHRQPARRGADGHRAGGGLRRRPRQGAEYPAGVAPRPAGPCGADHRNPRQDAREGLLEHGGGTDAQEGRTGEAGGVRLSRPRPRRTRGRAAPP